MEEIDDPEVTRVLQALGMGQRAADGMHDSMHALDSFDNGPDTG